MPQPETATFDSDGHPAPVLVIDDDPTIHRLVQTILKPLPVGLDFATNAEDGLAIALQQRPELILMDYHMEGTTGFDLLQTVKAHPMLKHTPVIFITGDPDPALLTACFEHGASDYVRKPILAAELRARVGNALNHNRLLRRLHRQALHDNLTGLPNRSSILQKIQEAIDTRQALPDGSPRKHFAVLFLDFDRFKLINDSMGHEAGDQLLTEIAERLMASCRASDWASRCPIGDPHVPARLGGDEFVVLLNGLHDPQDAELCAQRLLNCFTQPYHLLGQEVYATASIGVVHETDQYLHAGDILRDADAAMYAAKAAGKSQFVIFDQALRERVQARAALEREIRQGIKDDEFRVLYQPIVDLNTGRWFGCEALLRWQHPTRGLLGPKHFLNIADETRLIVPMGQQVLNEACKQWQLWHTHLGPDAPEKLHVNLTRSELLAPGFMHHVEHMLKRWTLPKQTLCLEISEDQLMSDPSNVRPILDQLQAAGVCICMDNFGTGHASLTRLQSTPLDLLKIDRTLTQRLDQEQAFSILATAAIALAENMQLHVIAEGIEMPSQVRKLQTMGCQLGQGHHWCSALRADQVLPWYHTRPLSDSQVA